MADGPAEIGSSVSPAPGISRLDKIHEEIAWHHAQIATLKAEANSFCQILNLPTEITSKIFHWYALESNRTGDLRWTKIMFVCRRWHDIALADQQLWGFIHVAPFHTDLDQRLQRSGAAPLNLRIEFVNVGTELAEHLHRLREIDLTGGASTISPFVDLIPLHTLPLLRSIALRFGRQWGEDGCTIPEALFDGRAPQLRRLTLSHVSVNLDLLCGLTGLHLLGYDGDTYSATLKTLLSVLERCADLEDLHLGMMPARFSEEDLSSLPVVNLPCLRSLHLAESVFVTTHILRHISFPAATSVSISTSPHVSGGALTDLLGPLRRHLRAPDAPTVARLRLECVHPPLSVLAVRTYAAASVPTVSEDQFIFVFHVTVNNDNVLRQVATQVLKLLPRTTITYLDARAAFMSLTSWRAALPLLPALELLHTGVNRGAGELFQALAQLCGTSTGGYPHLRRIRLSLTPWEMERFDEGGLEFWFGALRDLLRTAHAHELPLECVDIEDPGGDLRDLFWNGLFDFVGTIMLNNEAFPTALDRLSSVL
ncbi:hypothetical protein C8R46DRAFT_269979 [Mycena filopes]|nr:hypothetical protein C8R46DRAFT_269979 [Mycena filopes]